MPSFFDTTHLFDQYYYKRSGYIGGTTAFHDFCVPYLKRGAQILDVGAGPSNSTSDFLATLGSVCGLDITNEVSENRALESWRIFDGKRMPFEDNSFDCCFSNWVLEHVESPVEHFQEIARILRPGGVYCFRTMNAHHYVGAISRFSPQWFHNAVANRVRALKPGAHDPYPTFYRCNTLSALRRIAKQANFANLHIKTIEAEPSYGKANPLLFYPMFVWERAVNAGEVFQSFRASILGAAIKP